MGLQYFHILILGSWDLVYLNEVAPVTLGSKSKICLCSYFILNFVLNIRIEMTEKYSSDLFRVVIAQISQTIGYSYTLSSPLELLQDVMKKFVQEFAQDMHCNMEHGKRCNTPTDKNKSIRLLLRIFTNLLFSHHLF